MNHSKKTKNLKHLKEAIVRKTLEKELKEWKQKYKNLLSEKLIAQQFSQTLLVQQEEDRKIISRELHDEIAQILTGINFELASLIKESSGSAKKLQTKIIDTQKLVIDSVEIIHRFARNLRPLILDDLGLIDALESYIRDFSKRTSIIVQFKKDVRPLQIQENKKTVIYRVVQESLTNIEKHSQATKVSIILRQIENKIQLRIHDNGKSFYQGKLKKIGKKNGIGIIGMSERVKNVHGEFDFSSRKSEGTIITVSLPIDKKIKK